MLPHFGCKSTTYREQGSSVLFTLWLQRSEWLRCNRCTAILPVLRRNRQFYRRLSHTHGQADSEDRPKGPNPEISVTGALPMIQAPRSYRSNCQEGCRQVRARTIPGLSWLPHSAKAGMRVARQKLLRRLLSQFAIFPFCAFKPPVFWTRRWDRYILTLSETSNCRSPNHAK